jgi:hypothetical protein
MGWYDECCVSTLYLYTKLLPVPAWTVGNNGQSQMISDVLSQQRLHGEQFGQSSELMLPVIDPPLSHSSFYLPLFPCMWMAQEPCCLARWVLVAGHRRTYVSLLTRWRPWWIVVSLVHCLSTWECPRGLPLRSVGRGLQGIVCEDVFVAWLHLEFWLVYVMFRLLWNFGWHHS